MDDLFVITERYRTSSLVEEIVQLFSLTALIVEGDSIATRDEEYFTEWEWGPVSGQLHFSSQNNPTVSDRLATEVQILRSQSQPSPALVTHKIKDDGIPLPTFKFDGELNAVMRARRTIRSFLDMPVELSIVSDALFAGLGITGIVSTDVGDHPLRMTPSPGARNAYEGYIFARNVSDLSKEKFYHYASFDHELEAVKSIGDVPTMDAMFASNQPWVRNASLVILLVAYFERVM